MVVVVHAACGLLPCCLVVQPEPSNTTFGFICTASKHLYYVGTRARLCHVHAPVQVSPKLAAVLVPLFEDGEGVVRVLLTQRSSSLPTHQGEVRAEGGKGMTGREHCKGTMGRTLASQFLTKQHLALPLPRACVPGKGSSARNECKACLSNSNQALP